MFGVGSTYGKTVKEAVGDTIWAYYYNRDDRNNEL
jgi:hypothetical protein